MPPPFQSLDHVHVYVANRATAEVWYQKVLGFARIQKFECWAPNDGPLMLGNESIPFKIALFERNAEKRHSTIAFAVTGQDFLAWRSHLTATLDHSPELEDHKLSWSLYFHDPDGNPYEITSYDYSELRPLLP